MIDDLASLHRLYWGFIEELLAAWLLLWALFLYPRLLAPAAPARDWLGALVRFGLVAAIGVQAGFALLYLVLPYLRDYAEPMVIVMARNWWNGGDLYFDWSGGEGFTGSLYGPYLFLLQAAVLGISPTITASKLVGIAFGLGAMLVVYGTARGRGVRPAMAATLVAIGFSLLLPFTTQWFWNRPDPVLILGVALACAVLSLQNRALGAILLGLLCGGLANLKLHAPIYLVPLIAYLLADAPDARARVQVLLLGFASTLAAAMLPFLLPHVSLASYLSNLSMAAAHGLTLESALSSLAYAMVLLGPPLCLAWREGRPAAGARRAFLIAFGISLVAMAIISSKPGSGPPHLMPFIPAALLLTALYLGQAEQRAASPRLRAFGVLNLGILALGTPILAYGVYNLLDFNPGYSAAERRADELRAYASAYPGLEMVPVDGPLERLGYDRVHFGFAGGISVFDVVNWNDLRFGGLEPEAVLILFEDCRVPHWVVPSGGTPFTGGRFVDDLFSDGVRAEFAQRYRLTTAGAFYDLYSCIRP